MKFEKKQHRNLFLQIAKKARRYAAQSNSDKAVNIFKILDKVIPLMYFGTKVHRRMFYSTVKLILTQSMYECIYLKELIMKYDLKKIPWLADINNDKKLCSKYLCRGQLWLLEKIVKPLILRYYTVVKKGQMYEVELVPKRIWNSFRQKVLNGLLHKEHLVPTDFKTGYRGFLQIRPKNKYEDFLNFRPIVRLPCYGTALNRKQEKESTQRISRIIRLAAQYICPTKTMHLYRCWKEYLGKINGKQVYSVKIDLQDAFGNVNIGIMCYILNMLQENKQVSNVNVLLKEHIGNQYVAFGAHKIWKWNRGLCQGDRFSSALCQLYLSYLDFIHLQNFYKPTTFLHRTVDDYFFCSTKEDDVIGFINVMNSVHVLNQEKTQSNISQYGHEAINYCGHTFLLNTGEVKIYYNFKKRMEVRHRFKLWNIQKPIYNEQRSVTIEKFLTKAMNYAVNNYHFQHMELNTIFNTERIVLENFFQAMIFLAFKFDACVVALRNIIKDFQSVTTLLTKCIYTFSRKSLTKLVKNKGVYHKGEIVLEHFLKIGARAFLVVLKKRRFYMDNLILEQLVRYENKFVAPLDFNKKFRKMPCIFNNISIQRRLPCHKKFKKLT
ncbi:hypothetical protein FQA39_LY07690 [Lamprigera yunnana]|nr:hypothetical protein FQA39_LY07690 [Lamprigera yunnana]